MVISHKYKLIFIRVRKTASTSIQYALSKVSGPFDIISSLDDKDIKNVEHAKNNWCYIPSRKPVFYNHIPAFRVREMIAHMDPSIWDNYFKFCFERNPWDRAISEYYYDQRQPIRSGKNYRKTRKEWIMHNAFPSFRKQGWLLYTDIDQKNIIVDKVFKYEEMDESIKYLIKRCNLPKDFKLSEHKFKGWTRKDNRHYRKVLSVEEKNRIEKVYHKEIKEFGYEY